MFNIQQILSMDEPIIEQLLQNNGKSLKSASGLFELTYDIDVNLLNNCLKKQYKPYYTYEENVISSFEDNIVYYKKDRKYCVFFIPQYLKISEVNEDKLKFAAIIITEKQITPQKKVTEFHWKISSKLQLQHT